MRANATGRSIGGPELRVTNRFVGSLDKRGGRRGRTGMRTLPRAAKGKREDAEPDERSDRAAGEPRCENDEQHRKRRERDDSSHFGDDAIRHPPLDVVNVACESREPIGTIADTARIGMSRFQWLEGENTVENRKPNPSARLARNTGLGPGGERASNELYEGRQNPGDGEDERRPNARSRCERSRKKPSRAREKRVAGRMHDRSDEGAPSQGRPFPQDGPHRRAQIH